MIRIVIADDERPIIGLIKQFLLSFEADYVVVGEASNGITALRQVKECRADVLIADIRMPGLSGLELMEQISQEKLDTEVIVVSGYNDFEYIQKALRYGAVDYLLKPINKKELQDCLFRIEKKRKENEKVNNIIAHMGSELSEQVLFDLEEGMTLKLDELCSVNGRQMFQMQTGYFAAVAVKLDVPQGGQMHFSQSTTKVITEKFERYFANKDYEVVCICAQSVGYLLLHFQKSYEQFRQTCMELRKLIVNSMYQYGVFDITVAVGRLCQNWEEIQRTFLTAKHALRLRIDLGVGNVILFDEVPEDLQIMGTVLKSNDKIRFQKVLESLDVEAVKKEVDNLFHVVTEKKKYYAYELSREIIVCVQRYMQVYMQKQEVGNEKYYQERLEDYIEVGQLREAIEEYISEAIAECLDWKAKQGSRPMRLIKEYIEEHYQETVSLEDVARLVCLSPVYVSTLFKKETGETFTAYALSVKMQKAKELLKTTDMTVSAVAEAVGYKDARYFSRQFYKSYGVKPKDYRKFYM